MQKMLRWAIVPVILIVVALYLSSRVSEQPMARKEKAVSLDALGK
ncbi:MAG: hypothetical protein AABY88_00400 [Pseudomonadota bacterium]